MGTNLNFLLVRLVMNNYGPVQYDILNFLKYILHAETDLSLRQLKVRNMNCIKLKLTSPKYFWHTNDSLKYFFGAKKHYFGQYCALFDLKIREKIVKISTKSPKYAFLACSSRCVEYSTVVETSTGPHKIFLNYIFDKDYPKNFHDHTINSFENIDGV